MSLTLYIQGLIISMIICKSNDMCIYIYFAFLIQQTRSIGCRSVAQHERVTIIPLFCIIFLKLRIRWKLNTNHVNAFWLNRIKILTSFSFIYFGTVKRTLKLVQKAHFFTKWAIINVIKERKRNKWVYFLNVVKKWIGKIIKKHAKCSCMVI